MQICNSKLNIKEYKKFLTKAFMMLIFVFRSLDKLIHISLQPRTYIFFVFKEGGNNIIIIDLHNSETRVPFFKKSKGSTYSSAPLI